jgi:hypothetical protein
MARTVWLIPTTTVPRTLQHELMRFCLPFNTSGLRLGGKVIDVSQQCTVFPERLSGVGTIKSRPTQNVPQQKLIGASIARSSMTRQNPPWRRTFASLSHGSTGYSQVRIFEFSFSQNIVRFIEMLTMHRRSAVRALSSTDLWCEITFPLDESTLRGGHQSAKKIPQYGFNGCAICSQRRITI